MKKIFDIPRTLADARAGTLSAGDIRKAIEKAEAWGLSETALQLRELLSNRASASRAHASRSAAEGSRATKSD